MKIRFDFKGKNAQISTLPLLGKADANCVLLTSTYTPARCWRWRRKPSGRDRNLVKTVQSQLKGKLIRSREVNNNNKKKKLEIKPNPNNVQGVWSGIKQTTGFKKKRGSDRWKLKQSQWAELVFSNRFTRFSAFFSTGPCQSSHYDCLRSFLLTPSQSHLSYEPFCNINVSLNFSPFHTVLLRQP